MVDVGNQSVEDKLCFQSAQETQKRDLFPRISNMLTTLTEIPLKWRKKVAYPIMNAVHRKPIKPIQKSQTTRIYTWVERRVRG